jgi:hypothetical protein
VGGRGGYELRLDHGENDARRRQSRAGEGLWARQRRGGKGMWGSACGEVRKTNRGSVARHLWRVAEKMNSEEEGRVVVISGVCRENKTNMKMVVWLLPLA